MVSARSRFNHMVEQSVRLDHIFGALADPTRRGMLRSLSTQELSVGELAAPYRMSLAAASKHVKVLERAGLVRRTVLGRTHLCSIEPAALAQADQWLRFYQRFWTDRLGALEAVLQAEEAGAVKPGKPRRK